MRVLVVCIVIAFSLTIHGIECNANNLRLSNSHFSIETYKRFINNLRLKLHSGVYSNDNVPIMRRSAQDSERFYLFDLTSANDETITAAIDVVDASVVAYCAGSKSYFFSNSPQSAYRILFPNTTRNTMDFDNTFSSLEKAAGITRSLLPLGEESYDVAITSLFNHESVPESFLVIIQMVIEASKFRFIAQHVVNSLRDGRLFLPSLAILSLEDNWSELSFQIQASLSLQGLFGKDVLLYNSNDEAIKIDSIYYPIVYTNLAYQLYTCFKSYMQDHQDNNNSIIKMPGSVNDDQNRNRNKCIIEQKTVQISGRDGKCVDVAHASIDDGSPVILSPCGEQANQKWTFYRDDTIRSLGKCLAGGNAPEYRSPVVIYDCDKASREKIQWKISNDGTFVRSYLDVSLTARSRTITTTNQLTEEYDQASADQTWRVGNYVKPFIVSIVGLNDMCLEAINSNTDIRLEDCVKDKKEQSWAMYSDETIRVNQNRTLCVASTSTSASSKAVIIDTCTGLYNERWHLSEGTITNGGGYYLMTVLEEDDGNFNKIIITKPNYQDTQQWVVLY